MKVTEAKLKGCFIIEPVIFKDERGSFCEIYQKVRFKEVLGEDINFVQTNQSYSIKGTLRGLHFQKGEYAQSKLITVPKGKILDVVVDLRKDSATYGHHFKIELSERNHKMLFIPRGMAHGFLALEETIFIYQCDNYYNKESESGILYSDSNLAIDWEFDSSNLIVSEKDRLLPNFNSFSL
ncbi:5-epimerase [Maribacter dokdonensis]|uniref:dTDP-4-dehydrorhamnose 3,5-epimerase n=1 Tax=Maribacter dokdonensis TaxID=320912 RepID=UPI001B2CF65B|nr:dTDP-4-dehydrorhamnose 3,5-epimerase [Maribacter dokdonensis]CAG2534658.1 5-epimerase [Maribacter dokdonensis]